jgi:hypothetical protein
MSSLRPPALATWLLEHLLPQGKNEALAGDLLEKFGQQGSATWYWRQVLAAVMVGLLHEVRVRWIAICWAVVYSSAIPWLLPIWAAPQLRGFLFYFSAGLPWAYSLIGTVVMFTLFNTVLLLIALGLYLATMRHFNARRFLQALLVALPVLALGMTGMLFSLALPLPVFVNSVIVRVPLFFGLLISLWIAAPSGARADSKSLPAQNAPRA